MRRWGTATLAVALLAGCHDATGPKMLLDAPLFQPNTAPPSWTKTRDLSVGRQTLAAAAAAASDGRVFASGGLDQDGLALALVEVYTPAPTDAWTLGVPLPGDRFAHASVRGDDGFIYVIGGTTEGGFTVTTSVLVYDPTGGDSWTSVTDMRVPRSGLAAAVAAGGKIYVTGGFNFFFVEVDGEVQVQFQIEASGEVYDPVSKEWSEIASMKTPRIHHAMATGPDGRIYAIGGTDLSGAFIASVEVYDPNGDKQWKAVESLRSGRYGLGAATGADGLIYAYGGFAESSGAESTVFTYDVGANTWTLAPSMNEARFGFGATASPDGRIYAVAGSGASGVLNSAEFYETAPVTTVTVDIDIKPGSDPNSINRKSRGNVPVAVLSSSTFDATTVDRSTVVFAGALALSIGGGPEDVNGDGLADVVFHFATQALDLPDGTTEACLSGDTTGGTSFQGCDPVRLVK